MTSKKTAKSKRSALPLKSDYSKEFKKDWKSLSRSGRYDMNTLKEAMIKLIANDGPLGPEWKDHPLQGQLEGYRECHIGGDFLLMYQIDDETVFFVRAGTHSEL